MRAHGREEASKKETPKTRARNKSVLRLWGCGCGDGGVLFSSMAVAVVVALAVAIAETPELKTPELRPKTPELKTPELKPKAPRADDRTKAGDPKAQDAGA